MTEKEFLNKTKCFHGNKMLELSAELDGVTHPTVRVCLHGVDEQYLIQTYNKHILNIEDASGKDMFTGGVDIKIKLSHFRKLVLGGKNAT